MNKKIVIILCSVLALILVSIGIARYYYLHDESILVDVKVNDEKISTKNLTDVEVIKIVEEEIENYEIVMTEYDNVSIEIDYEINDTYIEAKSLKEAINKSKKRVKKIYVYIDESVDVKSTVPVPYTVIKYKTDTLKPGEEFISKVGVEGVKEVTETIYRNYYNGEKNSSFMESIIQKPEDRIEVYSAEEGARDSGTFIVYGMKECEDRLSKERRTSKDDSVTCSPSEIEGYYEFTLENLILFVLPY